MILAILIFCTPAGSCPVQHQFRLEAQACQALAALGSQRAEIPVQGEWRPAVVRVRCGGSSR